MAGRCLVLVKCESESFRAADCLWATRHCRCRWPLPCTLHLILFAKAQICAAGLPSTPVMSKPLWVKPGCKLTKGQDQTFRSFRTTRLLPPDCVNDCFPPAFIHP